MSAHLKTFNAAAIVITHQALATASTLTVLCDCYETLTGDEIPAAEDDSDWARASDLNDDANYVYEGLRAYKLGLRGQDGITLLVMRSAL